MDQRSGILRLQKKHPDTSAGIFPVHLLPAFYIFHHKMQHRVHYQVHDTGGSIVRGLRKYLTPFAPDQSGAVSVLYELGGLIAICDAGGCTGNVCGFDEPRWFEQKSALFSAGLRDMDAILGRDDRLVEKLVDAASKLDVKFVAIIGTPVPAVIGTDYKALGRMCEKKLNMPYQSFPFLQMSGKAPAILMMQQKLHSRGMKFG